MSDLRTPPQSIGVVCLTIVLAFAGCSNEKGDRAANETVTRDSKISTAAKPSEVIDSLAADQADNQTAEKTGVGASEEIVFDMLPELEPAMAAPLDVPPVNVLPRMPAAKSMARSAARSAVAMKPPGPTANQPSEVVTEMAAPSAAPTAAPTAAASAAEPVVVDQLPAGTTRRASDGFSTIKVFYGTDRKSESTQTGGQLLSTLPAIVCLFFMCAAIILLMARRIKTAIAAAALACTVCLGMFLPQLHDSIGDDATSYGGERGKFVHGVATVTVPDNHQRGVVERPSIMRFEIVEDQEKHIVLTSAIELEPSDFYNQISETVQQSSERDLLVFIHGYNVDFESALRRTAQIAVDLPFRGVPVCYSWPSQGSVLRYTVDENNVTWTIPHLRDFLLELAERSGANSINVVAHSMGNRAMASAMSQISLQLEKQQLPLFDRIVLAAPDIDSDFFRKELGPRLAQVGRNVTLYASSDDQALVVSRHLHGGYPRAGESGDQLVVIPDIETIDVSGIDLSLLGHSYYGGSESILRDLYDVVRNRLPASQRDSLISKSFQETTYWLLKQPQVSEVPDGSFR